MKYSLICYASSSYKSAQESIENSGNWFIANFEQKTLTLADFTDDNSVVRQLQITANNAMDVFGHVEDVRYFVTEEDENDVDGVLFYESDNSMTEWVENKPKPEE